MDVGLCRGILRSAGPWRLSWKRWTMIIQPSGPWRPAIFFRGVISMRGSCIETGFESLGSACRQGHGTLERWLPIAPAYGSYPAAGAEQQPPPPGTLAYDLEGRLVIYAGLWGWQRLRWWAHGRRLVMADLEPGEQEARRLYLRKRAQERGERRADGGLGADGPRSPARGAV